MSQDYVYKMFTSYFPQHEKRTELWFPNGKNSVRVRQVDGQQFIFTYNGPNDWCFETMDSFVNRMKLQQEKAIKS